MLGLDVFGQLVAIGEELVAGQAFEGGSLTLGLLGIGPRQNVYYDRSVGFLDQLAGLGWIARPARMRS